jgi:amino acid transporter
MSHDHSSSTTVEADLESPTPVSRTLRGNLGVGTLVFIVVAAMSPLGVIGGPVPIGIAFGDGAGFPATYIITGIVLLFFAVGFTAATPFIKSAGAFFAYIDKGLGRGPGIGAAFVALFSYVTLEAGVFGLLGPGVNTLLQSYNAPTAPWWVWALIALVIAGVFAYRHIELSGKVLAVLTAAEVLIVIALDLSVVFHGGGPEGFSTAWAQPSQILSGAPGFGILFAILSFIGFETAAVFRDEVRDPERTIPRATYISLVIIGLFYAWSAWALISGNGQSNIVQLATNNLGGILGDTTATYLGTVGAHVIQVLFVTSLFACILSLHNVVSRYLFTLSKHEVLPHALSVAHPKFHSPARSAVGTSVIILVLIAGAVALKLDPIAQFYTWLGGISSVGVAVLLLLTSLAVIVFFRKDDHGLGLWKTVIAPGVALLGLGAFLFLILQNLPTLVGEGTSYGPFSWGVLVILLLAFVAGPVLALVRPGVELD